MIEPQRAKFAVPEEVAYFNCASLAPLMNRASVAATRALEQRAKPWQIQSKDWFDDVERRRLLFSRLLGVEAESVALVPATSYGLAIASRNLSATPGQRILILADDYPSNVYTWRTFAKRYDADVVTVRRELGQSWTNAVLSLINDQTAIVAVPNVHWTNGARLDLVAVGAAARRVNARLVVDASQSLGAMPFDVSAIQPDFMVAVGYKWLLGPFGLGYLYVAPEHRNGEPLEENWILRLGAEDFARLVDYQDSYQPGARRFDMGERTAFELTPAAIACLEQLLEWGVSNIADTLGTITARIETQVRMLGIEPLAATDRGPHMLGIDLPAAVREVAPAILKQHGVYVGMRGESLRVSPHLYTTDADIDRLMEALHRVLGHGNK